MNYTKTFLSGAALCALATAPALAAHTPKLVTVRAKATMAGGVGGVYHKTDIRDPLRGKNTSTFVFTIHETYTLGEATWYNVTGVTAPWTWVTSTGGTGCTVLGGKLKVGLAKHGVTGKFTTSATVTCSDAIQGFGPVYAPTYKLTSKTATKDHFTGKLTLKSNGNKYILKLPIKIHITH